MCCNFIYLFIYSFKSINMNPNEEFYLTGWDDDSQLNELAGF